MEPIAAAVCVCVCEREREREKVSDRERSSESANEKERQKEERAIGEREEREREEREERRERERGEERERGSREVRERSERENVRHAERATSVLGQLGQLGQPHADNPPRIPTDIPQLSTELKHATALPKPLSPGSAPKKMETNMKKKTPYNLHKKMQKVRENCLCTTLVADVKTDVKTATSVVHRQFSRHKVPDL